MRFFPALRTGAWIIAFCLCVQAQNTPSTPSPQSKDAQINETKGLPPRTTPADYQAQAQAGTVTVAAEFTGHSVPTAQGTFSTEDYVVVETAFSALPGRGLSYPSKTFLSASTRRRPCPASLSGWCSVPSKIPNGRRLLRPKRNRKPASAVAARVARVMRRPRRFICHSSCSARWPSAFKRPRSRKEISRSSPGRTDFLLIPRQDRAHSFARTDLTPGPAGKSDADAPAIEVVLSKAQYTVPERLEPLCNASKLLRKWLADFLDLLGFDACHAPLSSLGRDRTS